MTNFGGGGREKDFGSKYMFFIYKYDSKERSMCSRVQMFDSQKFIVSQKPNFCSELCCELSGDAARLDTPPASALDGLI